MGRIEVSVRYYVLDQVFNLGTPHQYGNGKPVEINTSFPDDATVGDLFKIPDVAELCEFGKWHIRPHGPIEPSSTEPLASIRTIEGKVRVELVRKMDGCLLEWDNRSKKWRLNGVNV